VNCCRLSVALLTFGIAACGSPTEPRGGNERVTRVFTQGFSAPIVDRAGKTVGRVTGKPEQQGLIVDFALSGLTPGEHAMHLHAAGRCDPPGFASSGPHWNPLERLHGTDNPQGPHEGDWDNLDAGSDGRGSSNRMIPRWHGKIPESGLSLVFHQGKDDEATQPDGNSGRRIACAFIVPPA
jgi:Cu-Zn family superoxide dismutase